MTEDERTLHEALKRLVEQIRRGDYRAEGGPLVNNGAFIDAEYLITERELAIAEGKLE
jgi:hypothetical protein